MMNTASTMGERIKVLHVVTSLEPGGMENGVVNMARALEPRGIEMHVACLEREGAFAERMPAPGRVQVMGKSGGFSRKAAFRLARVISEKRPHIVHSHNLGPLIYSGLATAFGLRSALVHGEHSQLTKEELHPRRLRQRRWLYRACRVVHSVSQGIHDELLGLGFPPERLKMLANGVDTGRFQSGDRDSARAALGLPRDAAVLGIVGRFGPYKRHDVLIESFEKLAIRNVHLLIVGGGGSEESRIAERARRSLCSDRIHLTGFRSDPEACYQALDLLVVPSINEGMSNAALEAMACGVPVLANTGCGHEQIIDHGINGRIAPIDTSERLAAELISLLAEPSLLVESGRHARQTVEKRFSIAAMADAYERLYRQHASNTPF